MTTQDTIADILKSMRERRQAGRKTAQPAIAPASPFEERIEATVDAFLNMPSSQPAERGKLVAKPEPIGPKGPAAALEAKPKSSLSEIVSREYGIAPDPSLPKTEEEAEERRALFDDLIQRRGEQFTRLLPAKRPSLLERIMTPPQMGQPSAQDPLSILGVVGQTALGFAPTPPVGKVVRPLGAAAERIVAKAAAATGKSAEAAVGRAVRPAQVVEAAPLRDLPARNLTPQDIVTLGSAPPAPPPVPPNSALGRVEDMWRQGPKKPSGTLMNDRWLKLQEQLNDTTAGIRNLQKQAEKKGVVIDPGGENDAVTLLTIGPGAANAGATRYQLTIKEIARRAPGVAADDVNTALFLRHGRDILRMKGPGRKLPGGLNTEAELEDALIGLKNKVGEEGLRKVVRGAEVVRDVYRSELLADVDAGFVAKEVADELIEKYPWYNPLRYLDFIDQPITKGKSTRPISVSENGIKKLADIGSERAMQPPMEALADALVRNETRRARNATAKAIIKLAEDFPELGIKKVRGPRLKGTELAKPGEEAFGAKFPTTSYVPPDANLIHVWDKGIHYRFIVPDWMYREMVTLTQTVNSPVTSLVGSLNGISRAAFTTFSPPFVVANMLNDSLTAAVSRGILPVDTMRRLAFSLRGLEKDKTLQAFRLSGGYQMRFYGRDAKQMAKEVGASGGKIVGDNRSFKRAVLDAIPRAGEAGEQAPRMALFERELNRTLPGWRKMDPKVVAKTPQGKKAAASAVELTINFQRGGYLVKSANPFVIFLNANMEGMKLPFRVLKSNSAARMRLAGIAAGWGGLTAYNMSYPEYFDVPNDIRWGSVVIMLPSKEKNANGNPKPNYVVIIPRTREWAFFLAPQTYIMERLVKDNPTDFWMYARTVAPTLIPLEIPAPEILSELYGQFAGWDFYRNRPIVPTELQHLPAEEQVTPWTSRTVQEVAQRIGRSPVRADHFIRGITGGAGSTALSVSDYILDHLMPRQADPQARELVRQYREMEDATDRRAFLTALPEDAREKLFKELRQPEKGLPVASAIIRRVKPDRGGQLRRTGEETAKRETGLSPDMTRKTQETLRTVSDRLLTRQQELDTYLEKNPLAGKVWVDERQRFNDLYEGALQALGVLFPGAAQVQADESLAKKYYDAVYTLAGAMPDLRSKGQVLVAGYYAIPLEETEPGMKDWRTFFDARQKYKNGLGAEDRELLEEELRSRQTATEQRYNKDREVMDNYYGLISRIIPENSALAEQYEQYSRLQRENPSMASQFLSLRPQLKMKVREVEKRQEMMRVVNRNLDAVLVKWRGAAPKHPQNKALGILGTIRWLDAQLRR